MGTENWDTSVQRSLGSIGLFPSESHWLFFLKYLQVGFGDTRLQCWIEMYHLPECGRVEVDWVTVSFDCPHFWHVSVGSVRGWTWMTQLLFTPYFSCKSLCSAMSGWMQIEMQGEKRIYLFPSVFFLVIQDLWLQLLHQSIVSGKYNGSQRLEWC